MLKWLKYNLQRFIGSNYEIVYNPEFREEKYSLFNGPFCIGVFNTFDEAKLAMQQRITADNERCCFHYNKNGEFIKKTKSF